MKNCNKQNKKIELVDEKTLVIGVDIGSYDEYACTGMPFSTRKEKNSNVTVFNE